MLEQLALIYFLASGLLMDRLAFRRAQAFDRRYGPAHFVASFILGWLLVPLVLLIDLTLLLVYLILRLRPIIRRRRR